MNHHIISEIRNKKNLKETIPKYLYQLMEDYYNYAFIQFTMNYFSCYEIELEEMNPQLEEVKPILKEIHSIVKLHILERSSPQDLQITIKKLHEIREMVITKMDALTAYTDKLQIYEYILNRIEPRFLENLEEMDILDITEEVIQYIFKEKDNSIINERIKEVLGQLPVRMTKAKYFDLLSNSLSLYKGSHRSSVKNYIYILKTCGMLYEPEDKSNYFPVLRKQISRLEHANYKTIQKEQYEELSNLLQESAAFIQNTTDYYIKIQELINPLYIMLLGTSYLSDLESEEEVIGKKIVGELHQQFIAVEKAYIVDEMVDLFTALEGKQERLSETLLKQQSILYEINENEIDTINSLMLKPLLKVLIQCQKLSENSIFMQLEEDREKEIIADDTYINQITTDLLIQFDTLFGSNSVFIKRAVISNILSKMPIFFTSQAQLVEYIKRALEQCHDKAEQYACVQILKQLIEQ